MVARRSRDLRYDRPLFPNYSIDKARLSRVRRSGDDNQDAILQWLDAWPVQPGLQIVRQIAAIILQALINRCLAVVIVDRPLGCRSQRQHALLPVIDLTPQHPARARQCGPSLALSLCLEQDREAMGFGEIDPTVRKGAARELAWFGHAQAFASSKSREDVVELH